MKTGTQNHFRGIDMGIPEDRSDENTIRALIGAHFQGMKWTPTTRADWSRFAADFLPDASLFPAARPARAKTLNAFIERMKGVAQGSLRSFEERTLGMQVQVFGNVAVVMAASELVENETEMNHDMHGYLLVKDEGEWRIAAHAWDQASEQKPVSEHLRHAQDSPSSDKA
jgi:ketosteroid isomerase-like protein